MRISPGAFEVLARRYVNSTYLGVHQSRPIEERTFKAFFRLCSKGVASLWFALEEICSGCFYEDGIGPKLQFTVCRPEHLLLCLHALKTYCSNAVGARLFCLSEKTYRRYYWAMIHYLGHLAKCTVSTTMQLGKSTLDFTHFSNTLYSPSTDSTSQQVHVQ